MKSDSSSPAPVPRKFYIRHQEHRSNFPLAEDSGLWIKAGRQWTYAGARDPHGDCELFYELEICGQCRREGREWPETWSVDLQEGEISQLIESLQWAENAFQEIAARSPRTFPSRICSYVETKTGRIEVFVKLVPMPAPGTTAAGAPMAKYGIEVVKGDLSIQVQLASDDVIGLRASLQNLRLELFR